MYPGEYDRDRVKEWAGDSQWRALRADLARYKKWGYSGWGSEGFWALGIYRAQRVVHALRPRILFLPARFVLGAMKKLFTMVTQINLEPGAEIGPGMLIPHVGPIRVHEEAKIGADCAIHHVVTIGAGNKPGGARIGDHVLLGCHSVVLGPVHIGDGATIASGSLVLGDVPAHATAIGVPARILPGAWRTSREPGGAADGKPAALVSTPPAVPPSTTTAYEAVLRHAETRGDAPALTAPLEGGGSRTWSFATWALSAQRARTRMAAHLAPDAPAMIFSRRTPECAALLLAAIGDRRAFSCLNPRWRWPQLRRALEAASSRVLFVDREGMTEVEATSTAESRAGFTVVSVESLGLDGGDTAPPPPRTHENPSATRVGCVLFTSGSTGEPKGVCISEQDLAWRAETEVTWYGLQASDVLLNLLPFSFDVGLNQLLAAAYAGCETVLCESWLPGDVLTIAAERRVTGIPCVPSIWQDFIVRGLSFDTRGAHRHLRFLTISGGDLPHVHLDRIPAIAPGVRIFKTYGQTEAFRAASLRPDSFADGRRSVGGPFPGVTLCVVRPDGSIARRGETGELVHAGLGVMLRYLGDEERTRSKLRPAPFDEARIACFSGDTAFIDDADRVHLVGRSDQMVKILGNRVYPSEVRNALCELPGVADAVVLSEGGGQHVALVAFVVLREALGAGELLRQVRRGLPGYMVPACIEVVDALPRTGSGKPDAESLRPRARELLLASTTTSTIPPSPDPAQLTTSMVAARIEALVRERIDAGYSATARPLSLVLDSISFIDIVSTVDSDLSIGADIGRLDTRALASPAALASAMLDSRRAPLSTGTIDPARVSAHDEVHLTETGATEVARGPFVCVKDPVAVIEQTGAG